MGNATKLTFACLAGLAALGLYALLIPGAVLVETESVAVRPFTVLIEEDGRTRVRDRYIVSAPLAGRVPRTALKVGDAVTTGAMVATISPNISPLIDPRTKQELDEKIGTAQAAIEEAAAMKQQNEILLRRARTDLDRTSRLSAKGVTSEAQLDRDTFAVLAAERESVAAERRQHAAEHLLAQAKAALKRSTEAGRDDSFPVTSPIAGRVLRVLQESEAVVSLGAPLAELGDPTDLEVVVDVLTMDAARIQPADKVILDRWGGDKVLEGRVRRVEPSGFTKVSALGVEEQRVWVVIDIVSPHEDWLGLGDGYRVDTSIVVDLIEQATVIPVGALFRRDDEWHVFRLSDGRARLQKVKLLRQSGRHAAIAGGLQPGQVIVVYPPSALADGSRVRVQ